MEAGAGDDDYLRVFEEVLAPRFQEFRPQCVLVSAGFDAHRSDPLGGMNLTEEGYSWLTRTVRGWARDYCDGRILSTLEGGYDLDALARSVESHLGQLLR